MTEHDEKYLAKLRTHWKRHAAFPSMAKLCDTVGLSSTSSVFALVGRLVDAGYLERVDGRIAPTRKFFARPLLSRVRAGQPQPASQEEPEVLTIDDYLIDDPKLLQQRGRPLKRPELLDVPPFEGVLKVNEARDYDLSRAVVRARLIQATSGLQTDVLPELSDVRLVWAEDNKLRLTGFEEVDGAAYAQTWVVETA